MIAFLTFPYLINNGFIELLASNFGKTNETISKIINNNLYITLIVVTLTVVFYITS